MNVDPVQEDVGRQHIHRRRCVVVVADMHQGVRHGRRGSNVQSHEPVIARGTASGGADGWHGIG